MIRSHELLSSSLHNEEGLVYLPVRFSQASNLVIGGARRRKKRVQSHYLVSTVPKQKQPHPFPQHTEEVKHAARLKGGKKDTQRLFSQDFPFWSHPKRRCLDLPQLFKRALYKCTIANVRTRETVEQKMGGENLLKLGRFTITLSLIMPQKDCTSAVELSHTHTHNHTRTHPLLCVCFGLRILLSVHVLQRRDHHGECAVISDKRALGRAARSLASLSSTPASVVTGLSSGLDLAEGS